MKRILTILILLLPYIIVLTLLSCETATEQVTISKDEYEKLKGDTLGSEYPKPFKLYTDQINPGDDGIVLGSDKHEYLVWNYGGNSCNVEHYIDCKLCEGKEPLIK